MVSDKNMRPKKIYSFLAYGQALSSSPESKKRHATSPFPIANAISIIDAPPKKMAIRCNVSVMVIKD
jgi:hypothetical protein